MVCDNCDPNKYYPGKLIKVKRDMLTCLLCDDLIASSSLPLKARICRWDTYFHNICIAVASKSPCLSRQIGAILVRDHSIIATGYNGPPRGIPHCGEDRLLKDDNISGLLRGTQLQKSIIRTTCPRRILNYESGTHLELCPAQHAETNCIANAARMGVNVSNSSLYMNCVISCKNCFGAIINAGIVELIVDDAKVYDQHTQFLIDNSNIKIREFEL